MLKVLWKFSKLNEGCQPQPSVGEGGLALPLSTTPPCPCAAPVSTGRGENGHCSRADRVAENWLKRPELKLGDDCNSPVIS